MRRRRLATALLAAVLLGSRTAYADPVTITVTGTVDEPGARVTVSATGGSASGGNGIAATITGTTYTASGIPLALGPNLITATAADAAGNTTSASITVHLRAWVNVQGTADASVTTVTVNGVTATLTAGTFSVSIPMTLGVNTVTANAQDAAGNTSSKISNVFLARPPVEHP